MSILSIKLTLVKNNEIKFMFEISLFIHVRTAVSTSGNIINKETKNLHNVSISDMQWKIHIDQIQERDAVWELRGLDPIISSDSIAPLSARYKVEENQSTVHLMLYTFWIHCPLNSCKLSVHHESISLTKPRYPSPERRRS